VPADEDDDWRLRAELDCDAHTLETLVSRLREPATAGASPPALAADVVITHDGRRLFAYAADRPALEAARRTIEAALREHGVEAREQISHWDRELDDWLQVEPAPADAEARAAAARTREEATALETRTLVANVGREIRREFEQSLQIYAEELAISCELVEHRHLLGVQVAFQLTGPKRKLDEFAAGLKAEERATIRTETAVMASPL